MIRLDYMVIIISILFIGGFYINYVHTDSIQDSRFSGNAESFYFSGQSSSVHFKAKDIFLHTNESTFINVRNITIENSTGEMGLINSSHSLEVLYNEKIPQGTQSLSNVDITILFETSTKMSKNLMIIDYLNGSFNNINLNFLSDDKVVISRIGVNTVKIDGKELKDFNRIFFETDNTSTALFNSGKIDLRAWTVSDLNIVSPSIITNKAVPSSEIILNDGEGVLRLNDHIFDIRSADTLEAILTLPVDSHFIVNETKIKFVGTSNSVKLNNQNIIISDFSYWLKFKPEIIGGFGIFIAAFLAALSIYFSVRQEIIKNKDEKQKMLTILIEEFKLNIKFLENAKKILDDKIKKSDKIDEFLGFRDDGFNNFRNFGGSQYIYKLFERIEDYYLEQYNIHKKVIIKINSNDVDALKGLISNIESVESTNEQLRKELEKEKQKI